MFPKLSSLLHVERRFTAGGFLIVLIGGIALAEVAAMLVVYRVRDWPYSHQVVLDAAIMSVIIFPLIYFLAFKPLLLKIQQQAHSESIIQTRLRLMQFANDHNLEELCQFTLDEIAALTGSRASFLHTVEAGQEKASLQTGLILPFPSHLAAGGNGRSEAAWTTLFEEALHRREPVIHNNPNVGNSSANRPFLREIVVPVIRNSKVTAVLGVADKCTDYTADDLTLVATLSDFAWDVIEHKQSEIALRHSEQRFRTIADWTYAWEMWLDPQGNILYTSPASERITGYTSEDFITHSDLLINIIHPDDRQFYRDHERILHDPAADPVSIEYRILARDGQEYWLEHVCRPLWAPDDTYLGRRVSNRDVTQRKLNEQQIVEQLQKEAMLTQTIQNIQTDIARDLHDTLGQNISFLCLGLEDLSTTAVTGQTDPTILIQNMLTAANESYDLIRAMLHMLQSGYSADLLSLFTRYASQVAERSAIKIEVKSYGLAKSQLTPQQIRQLFFIFREALNNVEKHAHASQVSSEFHWQEQSLTLRITDNGQGFYQNPVQTSDHYGLKFMHERAEQIKGQLLVQSTLDEGTAITVIIPFENGNSSALL